ncbi:MAG: hypothetical protein JOZ22_08535 [Acidobacteriia bacterium]|nr:hypothetical protein [Terriglobia bacterium]
MMGNAGMSGFVSFLEDGRAAAAPAPEPVREPGPRPVPSPARRPTPALFRWARNGAGRQSRIWKATAVEDGHSLAEQAVYNALWQEAGVFEPGCEDRAVCIGYHRLAQRTRLTWVSVKSNLRSLEKKLAIEVIGSENSATQQGKRYRIYAAAAILQRRKSAGLVWVRRTRGVELLTDASFLGSSAHGGR